MKRYNYRDKYTLTYVRWLTYLKEHPDVSFEKYYDLQQKELIQSEEVHPDAAEEIKEINNGK